MAEQKMQDTVNSRKYAYQKMAENDAWTMIE